MTLASPPIACESLTRHYGRTVGIDSLDLTIERGSVTGFLGPNGAGKTTVIRLLVGLLRPTSGRATLFGVDASQPGARASLGYMPADPAFYKHLSGTANLDLLADLGGWDSPDREWATNLLELDAADLHRSVGEYSSGMVPKLGLVQAVQHRPDLVVLDAPANRLDPIAHRRFEEMVTSIARDGRTVFLSSHTLSAVEAVCHRVAMVRGGTLLTVPTSRRWVMPPCGLSRSTSRANPSSFLMSSSTRTSTEPSCAPTCRARRSNCCATSSVATTSSTCSSSRHHSKRCSCTSTTVATLSREALSARRAQSAAYVRRSRLDSGRSRCCLPSAVPTKASSGRIRTGGSSPRTSGRGDGVLGNTRCRRVQPAPLPRVGFNHPLPLMLTLAVAIGVASASIAGDVGTGRAELLYARPITRRRLVVARIGGWLAAEVFVLGLALFGSFLGSRVSHDLRAAGVGNLAAVPLQLLSLTMFVAGAGFLASSLARTRAAASALSVGVVATAHIVNIVAALRRLHHRDLV